MEKLTILNKRWKEVNQKEIIEFTVSIWNKHGSKLTFEQLHNWFNRLNAETDLRCIQAIDNEKIVGWLLLFFHTENEAEINPWLLNGNPIISATTIKSKEIAHLLVKEAIKTTNKLRANRLEINFKNNFEYNPDFREVYSNFGFYLLEENSHMRLKLDKKDVSTIPFTKDYTITSIEKVDKEKFFTCFQTVFRNSEDKWLLDKTDKELKNYFDNSIIESPFQLIAGASVALKKNDEIIAFSVVRKSHGQNNGHIWIMGVHPQFRKQGLGKALLEYVHKHLTINGFQTTSLNVDKSNYPAYNLYRSQGYKEDWLLRNYTWLRFKKG